MLWSYAVQLAPIPTHRIIPHLDAMGVVSGGKSNSGSNLPERRSSHFRFDPLEITLDKRFAPIVQEAGKPASPVEPKNWSE